MKRYAILFIVICFISCKSSHHYDSEAIKLNDSAARMQVSMAGSQLKTHIRKDSFGRMEIALLNKATNIDSDYFIAYFNKFGIQYTLQKYSDALATGKEMIRLAPKDVMIKLIVGKAYDQTGDSVRAKSYYKDYLYYCNGKLAFMPENDKERKELEFDKGLVLVLLNEPQQGHAILYKLYNESTNDGFDRVRDKYGFYMNLSKSDLLTAKDTCIKNGDNVTYLTTSFP